ncbi:MAG: 1-acyl-sn-glycerol-3-phosphate acyltransferase [Bacteroidales bacterium]|jgi:1-acyl-sn-glycerol-3-phosphate acyltransferase|nr:1-acyl-sn-glycerol-3-phosphate acyltransferase [Bacteroidales bacterium]
MEDFESIRPYNDSEVNKKLTQYDESSVFKKMVAHIYPTWTQNTIARRTKNITSAQGFQELLIFPAAKAAIDRSTEQFTVSGLDYLDPDENYLFISNHRDIVLDSTFLYYILHQNGYKPGQVAIGNNLLSSELVTDIVKMNRTFIVKRNLPAREMIEEAKILSSYMRYVLTDKKDSCWISHREGRTKDGNDRTNPGVLKMIAMDCHGEKMDYLKSLKIVPVSIAYEYDSCDTLKAIELTEIELTGSYKKDGTEDMKSIITGVTQQKGRVHFAFGEVLSEQFFNFKSNKIQEQFKELSDSLDEQIHQNFRLFPGNYIAADLLRNNTIYADKYNASEEERFLNRLNEKLELRKNKNDFDVYKRILLEIYANPVFNQLEKEEI